ncbi:MAG: hypothetical protein KZQ93_16250 [Candidatus Thiodiazotropha sp. (ex Monitilora ramsayi)]|nr:hypothetical protein [Candidatus Thiodiazotropha sp. (ex Monitilora ramsayi)]
MMYESGQEGEVLERFERELGANISEFEHGLNLGVPGKWDSPSACLYRIQYEGVELEIEILSQGERSIASLTLPLLKVAYTFRSGSKEQRLALLSRMDLAMQRGGG